MADDLLTTAERLLTGDLDITEHHPVTTWGGMAEVAGGTAFVSAFSNVAAFDTDAGLVLVDTSSQFLCGQVHEVVRSWRPSSLHTAVFTHGHVDHCFGVELYEEDARAAGACPPVVVAHEAIEARFARYVETAGYNEIINRRQFGNDRLRWPTRFRHPDRTYRDHLSLDVGGTRFDLHHARGETDDHTWVHVPDRKVLCTGDLFIWASPNCGNPQKVQRYALEWAQALRSMQALDSEVMLPGHGLPIVGADRIHRALDDAASLLEHLHHETVAMMNDGARLDEIVHAVHAPPELLERPYLRPVYDEPEFVVRNVWRLYGGWFDGNPAHLKPAPDAAIAAEVARLAGGARLLATRAREVLAAGDLRLAGHLAEWAALADPQDPAVHEVRAEVFEARRMEATSTMAKGIFGAAARDSRAVADDPSLD